MDIVSARQTVTVLCDLIKKCGAYLLDLVKVKSAEKFEVDYFAALMSRLEEAEFSVMLLVDEEELDSFQDTCEDFIKVFITPVIFATESVKSAETDNVVLPCTDTEKQASMSHVPAVEQSARTFFKAPTLLSHVGSMNKAALASGSWDQSGAVHDDDDEDEEGSSDDSDEPNSTTMMASLTEDAKAAGLIDVAVAVPVLGKMDRGKELHG